MSYCKVCRQCGKKMKQVPKLKINSLYMVEYYCDTCDISQTRYEDITKL